jgi:nucleotide-binding universal stress UspA family protein
MAYKSIFTAITSPGDKMPELAFAAEFANAHDAHLNVLCLGVDRTPNTYFEIGSNAVVMHAAIEEAHARASEIREQIGDQLDRTGTRWEASATISASAGVGRTVSGNARFNDLAIVRQPYGENIAYEASLVLEGLLFETDVPVLVVPGKGSSVVRPENIVIGWNESTEAMRAIRTALPLLQAAKSVHIAIIDPSDSGSERSDPGGALAVFLSRHNIRCDIQVLARQGSSISERLSQHVIETGSDMLVMGGYGHSRFREAVLGGATRDMLEHSKVPVLMAH